MGNLTAALTPARPTFAGAGHAPPSPTDHYVALDGLRGVAAIAVVLFHASAQVHAHVATVAYLAVDMFFVLSGFVIANAYEARLARGLSFGQFAWFRVRRLFPLYFAGLVLGLAYSILESRHGWHGAMAPWQIAAALTSNLFMLPTLPEMSPTQLLFPFNLPAWSLLFELLVNVVYGLGGYRLGVRALGLLVAIAGAWVAFNAFVANQVTGGPTWHDFMGAFPRVTFSFFGGVLLFRLLRGRPVRTANGAVLAGLVVLAALLLIGKSSAWHDITLAIFVFPLIVAAGTRLQPTGAVARACSWLGAISYALYIVHSPVIGWAALLATKYGLDRYGVAVDLLIRLLPAMAVAILLDRYWDGPLRQRLSGRPRLARARA